MNSCGDSDTERQNMPMHDFIRRAMMDAIHHHPNREDEIRVYVQRLMDDTTSPGDPYEIEVEIRNKFPPPSPKPPRGPASRRGPRRDSRRQVFVNRCAPCT